MHYFYLGIAVLVEAFGVAFLKSSDGFTKLVPAVASIICFSIALYLMSLIIRTLPVGVVYAIWSGAGIVLATIIGLVFYKQNLDLAGYLGVALIVCGVVILQIFSNSHA